MPLVELKGIGPAERNVVQLVLDTEVTLGNRNEAQMVKRLRRQLDLRGLRYEIADLLDQEKKELIDQGIDPQGKTGVSWFGILETGYSQEEADGPEIYGKTYRVDETTLQWFKGKRDEHTTWRWGKNGKDELVAQAIGSEMLEAIGNLDDAIEEALK